MAGPGRLRETPAAICDCDAVIVGASLAGCTTAILLARAGARVALVERRPDAAAFKRICSHLIQSSAVPTLETTGSAGNDRSGRGAARSRARLDSLGLDRTVGAERGA